MLALAGLLAEVKNATAPQAEQKGLEYLVESDPDLPAHLNGDEQRIKQVPVDLAGNAVKFTERGRVVLAAEKLPAGEGLAGLRFTVSDSGSGIPADKLQSIFERFTQLAESEGPGRVGAGLGTTIARQLVELMGGEIQVKSDTKGGGSRFWFEIELPAAVRSTEFLPPFTAGGQRPGRLLLLEDDGHQVTLAANGEIALAAAARARFDLIILDRQLPDMSGIAVCRRVRQGGGASAQSPIVALTAGADQQTLAESLAAGMREVRLKPLKRERLHRVVGFWLAHGGLAQSDPAAWQPGDAPARPD